MQVVWHHYPEFASTSRKMHPIFATDINPSLIGASCVVSSHPRRDKGSKTKSPEALVWFANSNVTSMASGQRVVWQVTHPSMHRLQEGRNMTVGLFRTKSQERRGCVPMVMEMILL